MEVTFHGVRGSTPVSGAEFRRTGGHTSCVALRPDDSAETLVLDAGTGIQRLGASLAGSAFHGTILLTHLHWDHVQGLPFFAPADRPDACTVLGQPAQGRDPEALLAEVMSPPHFPITPAGLQGTWRHRALEPGEHRFGAFAVLALEVPHKGGRAFGYRVETGGASIAYVPDHAPTALGPGASGVLAPAPTCPSTVPASTRTPACSG